MLSLKSRTITAMMQRRGPYFRNLQSSTRIFFGFLRRKTITKFLVLLGRRIAAKKMRNLSKPTYVIILILS